MATKKKKLNPLKKKIQELEREVADKTNEAITYKRSLDEYLRLSRRPRIVVPSRTLTYRFALCGDTQVGSNYERIDAFNAFLNEVYKNGIRDVYHTGDVLEGWRVYKGQEFEVRFRGFDEQVKHAKQQIDIPAGLKIRFIVGNHDYSFTKLVGMDVGQAIAYELGWEFIGNHYANVDIKLRRELFKLAIMHPGGGTAYALSYKPQNIAKAIEGGKKPDLLAMGHYHKAEMIPRERNMCLIQTGCFQDQTIKMLENHNEAHVGGWIVEVRKRKGVATVRAEFISFFK